MLGRDLRRLRTRLAGLLALVLALGTACARAPDPRLGMPAKAKPEEIAEARRLLELALDDWIAQTSRLQRLSQRIRQSGATLCGDEVGPVLGVALLDVDRLVPELEPVARLRFPERGALHVVEVFEGTPAAEAGIRVGDALTSVADVRTSSTRRLGRVDVPESGIVELELLRDGAPVGARLAAPLGCRFPSVAVRSDSVMAATDAEQIFVDSGLLRELADDALLSIVIGHEMAHAIMRRVEWSYARGPDVESRADYLGCYLAARAGFALGSERRLFEVLLRDLGRLDGRPRSHPASHERTRALRATAEEIRGKIRRGEPLVPEPA